MRLRWLCLLFLASCTVEHIGFLPPGEADATVDAVLVDAAVTQDTMSVDARSEIDAGPTFDAPPSFDAGYDAGTLDAGFVDASVADAGFIDAGLIDAGFIDAGLIDVGFIDVGFIDVGGPDAGPTDVGPRDMGVDVDVCAAGTDSDGDGVSDVCDRCEGGDDHIDVDGDGVPDDCDPWPCMDRPTPPSTINQEHIEISNVRLGDGTNRTVANAGDTVRLRFDFALSDAGCVGCRTQIETGSARSGRLGCIYDATPPARGVRGSVDRMIRLGGSGIAELRFNLGLDVACAASVGWWPSPPGPEQTYALICVRQ